MYFAKGFGLVQLVVIPRAQAALWNRNVAVEREPALMEDPAQISAGGAGST